MKSLISIAVVVAVLIGGFYALNSYIYSEKQGEGLPSDFREAMFWVSGEPVTLVDGSAMARTDFGGDGLTTIRYFGNELAHDIDGDGEEDTVFLITQETSSGVVHFYMVGALAKDGGYAGTQAVYIGEGISPQSTDAGSGRQVIVNYADKQSVGRSLYLLLDAETLEFGEVVQNFEGEEA